LTVLPTSRRSPSTTDTHDRTQLPAHKRLRVPAHVVQQREHAVAVVDSRRSSVSQLDLGDVRPAPTPFDITNFMSRDGVAPGASRIDGRARAATSRRTLVRSRMRCGVAPTTPAPHSTRLRAACTRTPRIPTMWINLLPLRAGKTALRTRPCATSARAASCRTQQGCSS
jgi:hypothetical protein